MNASIQGSAIAMNAGANRIYGAKELKEFIRKHTYLSFAIALGIIVALLLIYFAVQFFSSRALTLKANIPKSTVNIQDLPPPPSNDAEPPPPPPSAVVSSGGPASVAGNPVPVPETMLTPDAKDFADVSEVSRATTTGGTGEDMGGIGDPGNVAIDAGTTVAKEETHDDEFLEVVEDLPVVDNEDLQRKLKYPEMAQRQGIEGVVYVRVWVDKHGKPTKAEVDQSDNKLFNENAIKAAMSISYTPAKQGGQPVNCQVSIPIKFNLR